MQVIMQVIIQAIPAYTADKRTPAKSFKDDDYEKRWAVQDPEDAPVDLNDAIKDVVNEALKPFILFQKTCEDKEDQFK